MFFAFNKHLLHFDYLDISIILRHIDYQKGTTAGSWFIDQIFFWKNANVRR